MCVVHGKMPATPTSKASISSSLHRRVLEALGLNQMPPLQLLTGNPTIHKEVKVNHKIISQVETGEKEMKSKLSGAWLKVFSPTIENLHAQEGSQKYILGELVVRVEYKQPTMHLSQVVDLGRRP